MAKYQFAIDESGKTVNALDLAGRQISSKYICLGCDNELIAKVNGQVKKPHFAHKTTQECSGETYLHKLGKKIFFETYQQCLNEGSPFLVNLKFSKRCRKYKGMILKYCDLGHSNKDFDLTQYFTEILVEKRDGEFIPDLLLKRKDQPEEKIYIEIAVTHFLSSKKEESGRRIIEIPIETEEDIQKIQRARLTPEDVLFLGFNQTTQVVLDHECKCSFRQFFAFYVYDSGKSFLELNTLSGIHANLAKNKNRILYSNIIEVDPDFENSLMAFGHAHGELFIRQIQIAYKKKVPVKNCFLCKYQGDNWDYTNNLPIFCKGKKIQCGSNEAAKCDWYKPTL